MIARTSIDEIEVDFRRAEEARRAGQFKTALDGYLEILSRRLTSFNLTGPSAKLKAADLVVLERAADLAVLFGHDKGADDLLSGMASALESANNFFGADYTTVKRIHLALSFGRLVDVRGLLRSMNRRIGDVESLSLTDSGFDTWETTCHWNDTTPQDRAVIFSRLYLILGWLLASLGQYHDALRALKRGLHFTGNTAPSLAQRAAVPLRLTIVTALLEHGDFRGAREKLDELEPVLDRRSQPGSYVRWLELDGKLRMLTGDFGGALLKYLEVLRCCEESSFTRAALNAMLNLSHALIFLNNTNVAQQILHSVVVTACGINEHDVTARAKRQLALARERSSSFISTSAVAPSPSVKQASQSSINLLEQFPDIPQSENFLSLFEDRTLDFYWELSNRNFEMASVVAQHLRQAFGSSDSTLVLIRLQVLEGTLAFYNGHLDHAERLLRDSLPVLQELDLKPDLWQAQRILGWCWIGLGFPNSWYQQLTGDNQRLLSAMTASLPPGYQSVFLLNKWTAEEEFIAGEINQLIALKDKVKASTWFRKPLLRWSLMKRIHQLMQYVEQNRHSLTGNEEQDQKRDESKRSSLWSMIWNHPRDRSTICFLVLPDRVLVVHAEWMNLDFEIAEISRIDIREAVRQWHILVTRSSAYRGSVSQSVSTEDLMGVEYLDSLVTGARNLIPLQPTANAELSDEANLIAEKLAQQLLIPTIIKHLSKRVRALTIIPHDSLLGFPFAAITHEGSYLLERFDLNVDVSFFGQENNDQGDNRRRALFVGVSKGGADFQPLPGVLPEIHELEQWCGKRGLPYHTLLNESATKSAIIAHLNDSALLHMACHGVFRVDQPDASGLVLVPAIEQMEILSLRDLSMLNLSKLQHVSLSSCSSADNFILPGRWVIGLPETLRKRGVGSVLGCLWAINDRFAKSFAGRFYEYLNTYPRGEALRRTQLDCLMRKHNDGQGRPLENVQGIDTTDPFYWASYILCGDYRALRL